MLLIIQFNNSRIIFGLRIQRRSFLRLKQLFTFCTTLPLNKEGELLFARPVSWENGGEYDNLQKHR